MPEFAEREEYERKFQRNFTDVGAEALDRLLRLIGDPPSLANVPPSFWIAVQRELARRYNPLLKEIYLLGAGDVVDELGGGAPRGLVALPAAGIQIEWLLVNRAATDWAQSYTFDLVRGIDTYSRKLLQRQVSNFFEQQMTFGELRDLLTPTFGTTRGNAIGQTEVTRASVQGELGLVSVVEAEGVEMVDVFQTSNDAIVHRCPICWPLHGLIVPRELAPPLHTFCRCWLNHLLAALAQARGLERVEVSL